MGEPSALLSYAGQAQPVSLYVRLKRHRDEAPPPFLCVLRPRKRLHFSQSENAGKGGEGLGFLERAVIFKYVDCAPAPTSVPAPATSSAVLGDLTHQQEIKEAGRLLCGEVHRSGLVKEGEGKAAAEVNFAGENVGGEEEATTFWSAFNAPLRPDVFGAVAASKEETTSALLSAPSSASLGYQAVVEEAVQSLRRFKVNSCMRQGGGGGPRILDVCNDGTEQRHGDEFEYDLYAIECDMNEDLPREDFRAVSTGRKGDEDVHKHRLLQLLQQDRSAVALVEMEDVDEETGTVIRSDGGMKLFLEEFGDIDDADSGKRCEAVTNTELMKLYLL